MSPKAYSSFFFQFPSAPHSAPPVPPRDVYAAAQQQFRGRSFLSLDEQHGHDAQSMSSASSASSSVPSVSLFSRRLTAWSSTPRSPRTRPALVLDTRPHQPSSRPSPSSSRSLPKPAPTTTVLPSPPVLPELPHTPSLSLPFDFDFDAPYSAPVTKSVYPYLDPPKVKSTSVSPAARSPPRLKTSPTVDATPTSTPTATPTKSKPIPTSTSKRLPTPTSKPVPTPKPRPKPKTSPQSTPLQPRPITAPQPRRQRPQSTSTVSTHYRMVKRAGALACLEGKRDPQLAVGVGLVQSNVISPKSQLKWAESFMPLDDSSDDDEDTDVSVQVVGVRVRPRPQPYRGTIQSWYAGPADADEASADAEAEESRFSSPSQSPGSSRSVSPSPSPSSSSSIQIPYPPISLHAHAHIHVPYAASISAKSSPTLASMKPTGNFIDLDFEGEGDVYDYEHWR